MPPMSDADSTTSARGLRNQRRTLQGRVTSTRMKNTITVLVERTFKHRKYGKYMRRKKRYHAHDEHEQAHLGDLVLIAATRPISRLKRWRLVSVVETATERGEDVTAVEGLPAVEPAGGEA